MRNIVCQRVKVTLLLALLSTTGFLLTAANYPTRPITHTPIAQSHGAPSVYYGVNVAGQPTNLEKVRAFEYHARKAVSIVMWYQGWGVQDSSRDFQPGWMNTVRDHGAIPMVSWEPWNYTRGAYQTPFTLQSIIDGSYDAYITRWALASKAWGYPYFLRFAAEMNGNWYPWSEQLNGNKPGEYILAWQHVHDIFTSVGATNVTWVWSPNVEYNGSTPLSELYPGSAYVDWIGMDGYNWSTVQRHQWQTFSQVFQQTYQDILAMNLNKPLMIAETASAEVGGDKPQWISDAYGLQIPRNYPAIRAVIWFDEKKETDWRIESSVASQAAFANAIASGVYATNRFAMLDTSPIPALN